MKLRITEIFYSIQGESSHAGLPCLFVRLTGCNLRCVWCDTEYSFHGGKDMSFDDIFAELRKYDCRLVEVTGGEPLLQPAVNDFMQKLIDQNYQVLLETGGSLPLDAVPEAVVKIMDLKCPDSGECDKNLWDNLHVLTWKDEIKFVIASKRDYDWAKEQISQRNLAAVAKLLFSPVHGEMSLKDLAEWILRDQVPVRLQRQLHKEIWGPEAQGV